MLFVVCEFSLSIQIMTYNLLVVIWVQTVCKGYQQTMKDATSVKELKWADMFEQNLKIHINSSILLLESQEMYNM